MRYAVIDKQSREVLWHGECATNSFDKQKKTDSQEVISIDCSLDIRRKYRLSPGNELEDIGISQLGQAQKDHAERRTDPGIGQPD